MAGSVTKRLGLAVCAALALLATGVPAAAPRLAELRGSLSLPVDAALPRGARIEVRLEDVSRADAPALTLAETEIIPAGAPPYPFVLRYDARRIDPRMRYALRGTVHADGRLRYINDTHVPAFPESGRPVELPLVAVPATDDQARHAPLDPLPATFHGERACIGCRPGSETLELRPDGVFILRVTLEGSSGEPEVHDDLGTWSLDDGGRLVLRGGREAPAVLDLADPEHLIRREPGASIDRPAGGVAVAGARDLVLERQAMCAPLEPRLLLQGHYRYLADAARFSECLTGMNLPVALEADHLALEQAYLRAIVELGLEPGTPLLVSVEGWVTPRPRVDAAGTKDTLIIERFIGVWPAEDCAKTGDAG
jgi:uncharacterized lipoprotein YbaY